MAEETTPKDGDGQPDDDKKSTGTDESVPKDDNDNSSDGGGQGGEEEEEGAATNENLPEADDQDVPKPVHAIGWVENAIFYFIGLLLIGVAIAALGDSAYHVFTEDEPVAQRLTEVINTILFVVIVMEILRTVVAHFEHAAFQLKPFLIIGIISAVRHILTVGAELSLEEEKDTGLWHRTEIELGVNAGVVVALVICLALVRETEDTQEKR